MRSFKTYLRFGLLCLATSFGHIAKAGETVSLYDFGADEMGYLALPKKSPEASILFVPDSYGARGVVKQRCELMAKVGCVALAVDLYNGRVASDPMIAKRMQSRLDEETAVKAVEAALRLLWESPRYRSERVIVGVWGQNVTIVMKAIRRLQGLKPTAVTWMEPTSFRNLDILLGYSFPMQIVLREEEDTREFDLFLSQFDATRGVQSEVYRFEQTRGFLLEPKSSAEAVKAWSAIIGFWKEVYERLDSEQEASETPAAAIATPASIPATPVPVESLEFHSPDPISETPVNSTPGRKYSHPKLR
ncbi:MAG: dienelactone hydrolase family protein [Verrucomicrobiota bacterium]